MATPLVVGLVGGGTVGGGVYDIVEYSHKDFFASLGANVTIKKASRVDKRMRLWGSP